MWGQCSKRGQPHATSSGVSKLMRETGHQEHSGREVVVKPAGTHSVTREKVDKDEEKHC